MHYITQTWHWAAKWLLKLRQQLSSAMRYLKDSQDNSLQDFLFSLCRYSLFVFSPTVSWFNLVQIQRNHIDMPWMAGHHRDWGLMGAFIQRKQSSEYQGWTDHPSLPSALLSLRIAQFTSPTVTAETFRRQCLGRLAEGMGKAETWRGYKSSNDTRDACPSGARGENQHFKPRQHRRCNKWRETGKE